MKNIGRLVSLGTIAAVVLFLSIVAAAQTPTVQIVSNSQLGDILADASGMTLYIFTNDTAGQASTCNGTCATNWPPLTIPSGSPTAPSGLPGALTTIARSDGALQVAYDGMPLYTFVNDTAAGQTNGQGVNNVWFVALAQAAGTGTPAAAATTEATAAATAEATVAATVEATTAPTVAAAATSEATVAAAAASPTVQQALPTTGGSGGSWPLTVIVLGGLALLAGAGISVALQRQRPV